MLAVHWPQALPRPARQATDEMASGDEDEVRIGIRGERDKSVRTDCGARGRELERELAKLIHVAVRAQRDDAQAVRLRAHDVQSLSPDRTGGAEDRDTDRCGHESIIPDASECAGVRSESLEVPAFASETKRRPHQDDEHQKGRHSDKTVQSIQYTAMAREQRP